uniref:O-antigen ligase family protein n=1 Tax=Orrella sp. TaxID=1921583 RepID=UPI0040554671
MTDTKTTALSAENWMVFTLGAGLFLSKPVIYAATGFLTLYFLLRCFKDSAYRRDAFSNKLIVAALAIYVFGLVACLLMPTTTEDLSVIARKSLYLVIFAPLLLAFRQPSNKHFAMAGLFIGFWIAAILTFLQIEQLYTGRLAGATWMVDVWGVLCALFFVFLMPRIFDTQHSTPLRILFAVTALTAFILLILSGGRGPLLGVCFAVGLYLLFYQRRALGIILVIAIIAYFPVKHFAPAPVAQIEQRVTSIVDTQENMSNWIRLTIWKLSIAHSIDKFETNPGELLLGTGSTSHFEKVYDFFKKTDALTPEEKNKLSNAGYPTNDMHNMYLDAIAKHGLIWTLAHILLLIAVAAKG